jgi:PHD/YefM family antitoxin component YafN of YafNO toxin-antitoxin module
MYLRRNYMVSISITNLRKDLFKKADEIIDSNEPLKVTSKKGDLVVISDFEYRSMLATIEVLGNPTMKKIIEDGLKEKIEDCEILEW